MYLEAVSVVSPENSFLFVGFSKTDLSCYFEQFDF